MKLAEYETIVNFVFQHHSRLLRNIVEDVNTKFGSKFSYNTLLSICLVCHQRHVKETYAEKSSSSMVELYFTTYCKGAKEAKDDQSSILLSIAEQYSVPPSILARLMLRKYLLKKPSTCENSAESDSINMKEELSRLMKNPFLIKDQRLSYEVRQCILFDIGYGCVTDSIRHMIGLEYEDALENKIQNLGVPYQNENDMRKLGYDKTPDIKLEIPIAVKDQVVCWVESKASFGTPETHEQYLKDQYYSYLNRFGPGLVIYWFGFVEELQVNLRKCGILLMDSFPTDDIITKFQPDYAQSSNPASFSAQKCV